MSRSDARPSVSRFVVPALAALATFFAGEPAWAQGELEEVPSAAADTRSESALVEVHPPEVLESVEPAYPARALRQRLEATVVLRVTIDAEGAVEEADVIEPAGHGFG